MSLKLTLRELEVFVAVAEYGTVTQAAQQVALTQSAASQALDKLETGLDVRLFDRIGKRLSLNEHGRLLWPKARAMLDAAQDMQSLFNAGAMSLKIGASSTVANYLLPQQLAAFRAAWPLARLELDVANTRDIVDAVAALRVDFGFIEGPCHHPELIAQPWRQDELVVFAAADHRWRGARRRARIWRKPSGFCAKPAPARARRWTACYCRIWPCSMSAWSWGTRKRSSTRWRQAWASVACRGEWWPTCCSPARWRKCAPACRR